MSIFFVYLKVPRIRLYWITLDLYAQNLQSKQILIITGTKSTEELNNARLSGTLSTYGVARVLEDQNFKNFDMFDHQTYYKKLSG